MKVIFLGSPELSASILQDLLNSHHKVVGVVTQPDKPTGRGHKLCATPVKMLAEQHNIPVYQFRKIRLEGDVLKELKADIMVTAAFGQILSQDNINITPHGIINVHASLLPKYRGSCPINWTIINGEKTTGVTIMKTDVGIDTGDMLITQKIDITDEDNVESLSDKVAKVGGPLLVKALDMIESGKAKFKPQNHDNMSYFPMLKKDMGKIDFGKTAFEIVRWVNGLNPWPLAYICVNNLDNVVKVYKAQKIDYCGDEPNGTILFANSREGLVVKCKKGAVRLASLQAPNSRVMRDVEFLNGRKVDVICNQKIGE